MSKEYIERGEAIMTLLQGGCYASNVEDIMNIHAADVVPARHGVWEYEPPTINTEGMLKCSKCGWWTLDQSVCDVYHYCPECGAKMDMEE